MVHKILHLLKLYKEGNSVLKLYCWVYRFVANDAEYLGESRFFLPNFTDTGAISLPTKLNSTDLDLYASENNFYTKFTDFVNKTRGIIRTTARHGNFTLIQLALLAAFGGIAAGKLSTCGDEKIAKTIQLITHKTSLTRSRHFWPLLYTLTN